MTLATFFERTGSGLACFLLALLAGCDLFSPSSSDQPSSRVVIVDNWQSVSLATDEAVIHDAGILGDLLHLTVRYGGGCAEHEFELYADEVFLESEPPQAVLRLSHNAHRDSCKALIQTDLRYDLFPLRTAYVRHYGPKGTLLLRIHPPGNNEPFQPLVTYSF